MAKDVDPQILYSAVRVTPRFVDRHAVAREPTGTGFFVDDMARGGRKYLVTNRHILDPNFKEYRGWALETVRMDGHYQSDRHGGVLDATPQAVRLESPAPVFPSDPSIDLALLPLDADSEITVLEGIGGFNSSPSSLIATSGHFSSRRVTVGRQVLMPGYPGIGGEVAARPILVAGVIASDPRYPAAIGPRTFPNEVLCHAFSWEGMSGSPVLCRIPKESLTWEDVQNLGGEEVVLAGINAGHIATSGGTAGVLSRIVRADALASMLKQARESAMSEGATRACLFDGLVS
ncbi:MULTISPECIES: S1 family peptidase [unclassified Streptomyces]|uniref:S1 family peptidase n=1 Tax=unclassified Streptomyces TaxID=2593676 RepID=UPI000996C357|nr:MULTISPECIES: serine protease [unclassified Streptomyces]